MAEDIKVKLTNVRLTKAFLFKPWDPAEEKKTGEKKYKARFWMSKDTPEGRKNIQIVENAIKAAKAAKWGKKAPNLHEDYLPFRDGDNWQIPEDDEDDEPRERYWEGSMYVSAARSLKQEARKKMVRCDRDKSELTPESANAFYNGCYVSVILNIFGWDEPRQRVCATIEGVQFHKHGERFGGGGGATVDDFDNVSGEDDGSGDFTKSDSRQSRGDRQERDERRSEDTGSRARSELREDDRRDRSPRREHQDNVVEYQRRDRETSRRDDFEEEQPRRKAAASGGSRRPPVDEDDEI